MNDYFQEKYTNSIRQQFENTLKTFMNENSSNTSKTKIGFSHTLSSSESACKVVFNAWFWETLQEAELRGKFSLGPKDPKSF